MMKKRKLITNQKFCVTNDTNAKLYPKCDVSIWLRSCEKEIITPMVGNVRGEIPQWLKGSLLRNGPGSLKVGQQQFHHLFDSAALLHKFDIKNGAVTYQCRFIQTDSYKKNRAANRIVVTSFGTKTVPDPCHTIFQRISSIFHEDTMNDNTSISIYPFGDEFYAFTECPIIQRIDVNSLDTIGKVDVSQYIGVVNHTSHPYVMDDGTVYNLGLSIKNRLTQYNVIRFPNGPHMFENASVVAEIPARWQFNPSYMHTFGITENYFIIIEQPLSISVVDSLKVKWFKKPLASMFKWFQHECTLFHVICRRTGERKFTFKAAPFFYLHVINAYETADYIIVDICCYRDPAVLDCMYVEAMENIQTIKNYSKMFRSRPLRFILPTKTSYSQKNTQTLSWWDYLKNIACGGSVKSKEFYLKKYQNISNTIDSNRHEPKYWECFESNYSVVNLIKLRGSRAKAYLLDDDASIFCVPERLCDLGCETPRINDKHSLGKKYRYFYAISSDVDAEIPGTLIKADVDTKTAKTWNEPHCHPSEPIFIPAPGSVNEDDGVILSALIWGKGDENRVGLLVLCAKTFKELGRCEFTTPGPVPKCLHGWFNAS